MEKIISKLLILILFSAVFCSESALAKKKKDRIKIIKVEYLGNKKYSNSKLSRLTITKKSGIFKRRWFYDKNSEEDLNRLSRYYINNGYLDIKTSYDKKIKKKKNRNFAQITFKISEGCPYKIGELQIVGAQYYEESILRTHCKLNTRAFFTKQKVDSAVAALLTLYANSGFIEANIQTDLKINSQDKKVNIVIIITENSQFKAGESIINGISKTKSKIVKREIVYKKGDIIDASKLLDTQKNLFLTGLFSNVQISPTATFENDVKNIRIDLAEKDSLELGLSLGYDTIENFWQQLELNNYNYKGKAQKYGLMARRSEIRNRMELSFSEPRLWGSKWRGDVNMFKNTAYEPGYILYGTGGKILLGRDFKRIIKLNFSYSLESSRYSDLKIVYSAPHRTQWRHDFAFSSIYDTRDNIFNTLTGTLLEQINEYSITDKDLLRIIFRGRHFSSISDTIVLASAAELSFVISDADIEEINPAQRYYTGGPNSIRGFSYNTIGPLNDSMVPIGGKVKFVWNIAELRLLLNKFIGATVFIDAGNIWKNFTETDILQLRVSPGIGARFTTSLGVFRLEYAFNLEPEKNEDEAILYFGAGLAF